MNNCKNFMRSTDYIDRSMKMLIRFAIKRLNQKQNKGNKFRKLKILEMFEKRILSEMN